MQQKDVYLTRFIMSHWKKRRRTKAGRIAVSPFFFLLLALFAAVDRQRLLFPILSAAALHEAGHLAVLRLVGGQIEQFTLTPLAGDCASGAVNGFPTEGKSLPFWLGQGST